MLSGAGRYRERVKFERPTRTALGGGAFETNYNEILSTYAAIIEQRSNPEMVANQEQIINNIHIEIRYRSDVFLNVADRMVWRGFNYIINNFKVDPLRTKIDIYVNSEMETSSREPIITT